MTNNQSILHPDSQDSDGAGGCLSFREQFLWILLIWVAWMGYAIIRYNIFKGVEWMHLPLYITNKSLSTSGICFIAMSYLVGKLFIRPPVPVERRRSLAKFFGVTGFAMIFLHSMMSNLLNSQPYFEKLYHESGKLNLNGELTFLFGVLAFGTLLVPAITSVNYFHESLSKTTWYRAQQLGYLALLLACGHLLAQGSKGWLETATWPGSMPPLTLLGFLCAVLALTVKLFYMLRAKREIN